MLETKFNGMPETKRKDKCKSYKLYVGKFLSLHAKLGDKYTAKINSRRVQSETDVYNNVQSYF